MFQTIPGKRTRLSLFLIMVITAIVLTVIFSSCATAKYGCPPPKGGSSGFKFR